MIHIRRFIDKMSYNDGKNARDIVLPITDARGLRDDIAKLLLDLADLQEKTKTGNDVIQIEFKGGSFK